MNMTMELRHSWCGKYTAHCWKKLSDMTTYSHGFDPFNVLKWLDSRWSSSLSFLLLLFLLFFFSLWWLKDLYTLLGLHFAVLLN
ncbi:hypothetical protein CDL12_26971 [Handroanthus impetiginosus]|uniref:Uncharacterized protein n=1 Tax=Handroanthus impetiginosus TaxID=429701 RepID=A0A2G9G5D4_9LAMI|nr:hypothetical protein CDL12_26971 [Handroanthus impetiginosus]